METNLDTEGLNIMVKFSEVISWIEALAVLCAGPMAVFPVPFPPISPPATLAKVASSKTDNV